MIRKLLKVEFREAFSSMLPVGAGMLVLSALTALNSAVTARIRVSSAGFDWLGALLAFAAAVCFISVLAVCFFANVNRFYRMLGEEGYIQLTLPATMSQHIAAKLIAAVVTTLMTFLFLAVCSSLMAFPAGASWLTDMLRDGYDMVRGGGLSLLLLAAVIALAGMAMGYLHTYLSCAVGSLFPQHRKLASILSFFALQFLAQILFMLAVYFAATRMEILLDSFSRFALDLLSSPNGEMKAIFGSLIGVSAVEIVIDAVLWLITQTILTRKLNLP